MSTIFTHTSTSRHTCHNKHKQKKKHKHTKKLSRPNKKPHKTKTQHNIWNNWKKHSITFPKRKHFTLQELDKIPYVDENNKRVDIKNEREEQYVSHDFIEPCNTVLELGARYGVVSCVINHKLENPTQHVCIEPDKTVIRCLKKNKKTHNAHFKILNGIISTKRVSLKKDGYASRIVPISSTESAIDTYTIKYIESKYKLTFDTLVADCEGCLCDFITENKQFVVHQLKNIMFEADLPNLCNYKKIRKILKDCGFNVVVNGFVSFWKKKQ